jgi:hypothetical protein
MRMTQQQHTHTTKTTKTKRGRAKQSKEQNKSESGRMFHAKNTNTTTHPSLILLWNRNC